jgi:hypothetical protein
MVQLSGKGFAVLETHGPVSALSVGQDTQAVVRVDDVIGLRSDALLVRWTNFGTERAGGGAYERQFIRLFVFGACTYRSRVLSRIRKCFSISLRSAI